MSQPNVNMAAPNPADRPTRLPVWGQWLIVLLLLLSFTSGLAIWWGKNLQAEDLTTTPTWLRGAVILHGCLNPVQCVLFGILLCHHIRVGWQMRANLFAGLLMEGIFGALILTGIGLYYAPESWHDGVAWWHRALGVALPASLGLHWLMAHFWIRRVTRPAT